jgi:hypothetical protein
MVILQWIIQRYILVFVNAGKIKYLVLDFFIQICLDWLQNVFGSRPVRINEDVIPKIVEPQ